MQHSCSHSNAFGNAAKPAWIYAHGNTTWQHSCSHTNAICNQRFHKLIELRTHEEPRIAKHYIWRNQSHTKTNGPQPPHARAAFATFPEKTQCFALRLPPQNKPHATVMQPLQCVLQYQVAATKHNHNHAAMPLRSAATGTKHPTTAHTHTQTRPNHLEATATLREQKKSKRAYPQPPHTLF